MQRQAAGEIPFWFKNIAMAKQCKKLASAGDSTPTPAGQVGQPDGGQQETSVAQHMVQHAGYRRLTFGRRC
jgi:hypothetical protein